jgi:hypothetical protein
VGSAVRRTFADPGTQHSGFSPLIGTLQYYADLYDDADHEPGDLRYERVRISQRLPKRYRTVYNPCGRSVDFFPSHIYPGDWNLDGRASPDGRPNRVRFAGDVFEDHNGVQAGELPFAVMQALDWGNGSALLYVYVRTAAKLGSVLIECVDRLPDAETGSAGKVYPEIVDPRDVVDLELSPSGHVRRYALAYRAINPRTKQSATYRKEVDRQFVTTFWDDVKVSEDEHGYGFCPAAWVKHFDAGGDYGRPAVAGAVRKIVEYNRIVAPTSDWVAKFLAQPMVFWTDANFKANPDIVFEVPDDDGSKVPYLKLPPGGSVSPLIGMMPIGEIGGYLDRINAQVESDLPEIVVSQQLRLMSSVTGPGAARMMADAAGRLDEAQGNADAGLVKASQMLVAIGGYRLNSGAWGATSKLTRQQQKFAPFGLESFERGDLDFGIIRRPLIEATEIERIDIAASKENLKSPTALREVGYDDDAIATILEERQATAAQYAQRSLAQYNAGTLAAD